MRAISFGEIVIDDFPDGRVVAGSPLNVAVHLAARGWSVDMVSRVGQDPDGNEAIETLAQWGVGTTLVQRDPELPTGRVTVEMGAAGHKFRIHGPAAWDVIAEPDRLPEHDVFCYATLAGRSTRSLATLKSLLVRSGGARALDTNLRPPQIVDEALREGVRAATVMKVNDEELAQVGSIIGIDPAPVTYFRALASLQWLAITSGPNGARLYRRDGKHWESPGQKVEVVDTVGAGDAFFAGLIDSLSRGNPGEIALSEAQDAALEVVQHRGGLPPRR